MGFLLHFLDIIAGVAGILAGLALILTSFEFKYARQLSQHLLDADVLTLLNKPKLIERPIYRHHRVCGMVLIGATLLWIKLLTQLATHYEVTSFLQAQLGVYGYQSFVLVCYSFMALSLLIGGFLLIRPSSMKGFEAIANRWIDPFRSGHRTGTERLVSRLVKKVPRMAGTLLMTAGICCLVIARLTGELC